MSKTAYTVKEAAEIAEVDPKTVYRAVWAGRLGHYKTRGRFVRITKDHLDAWLNTDQVEPSSNVA